MSTRKIPQRKSALGRGLNALLQDSPFLTEQGPINVLQEIPIQHLQVNPFQPRKDFDATALEELRQSIQQHGIIQPLTVRKLSLGQYQLIAGERRLQAARMAGLTKVPAYIRMADDQQMLEMALVENIQREKLNPIEIALSYQRLLTECKIKQETLGERVGKDRTTVNNYLRLLKLPPDIQIALRDQKISMGHARALINVEAVSTQLSLLQEIIDQALSVRNVEARVRMLTQAKPTQALDKQKTNTTDYALQTLGNELATHLGTKVKIQASPQQKGEIKIAFANAQELDRILNLLQKVVK